MKCQVVLPACLLLLWTQTGSTADIIVKSVSDGIKVSCPGTQKITSKNGSHVKELKLEYNDENTREYECIQDGPDGQDGPKIFVKFRTCDNCIELDLTSILGLVVGELVATIVMGVAVYLVASMTRSGPITSNKKSSDRQHLVPNEVSNRATNDNYQPLRYKGGHKETYDVLANKK